jgi:hypothetical protein
MLRLLSVLRIRLPSSRQVTSSTRSAGWLVSTNTTSSPLTGWVVSEDWVISAAGGDGVAVVASTVHCLVWTNRGPL